jgi:hypothetical protein
MALLHEAKQLLGKMTAAASTVRTNRQIAPSPEVELLVPARPLQMTRLNADFASKATASLFQPQRDSHSNLNCAAISNP